MYFITFRTKIIIDNILLIQFYFRTAALFHGIILVFNKADFVLLCLEKNERT